MDANKQTFIKQLQKNMGNVSKTCGECSISRRTYYDWMEDDNEFSFHVSNIDEYILDTAEESLHDQIKEGNTTATIFFLKTRGRKRGYIEKQELEHSGQIKTETVTLFELPKNGRDEGT